MPRVEGGREILSERMKKKEKDEVAMQIKMSHEGRITNDIFSTCDMALAATLSLFQPIVAIERNNGSSKAYFCFERQGDLEELVSLYWRGELRVEPQAYFNQLKIIKARLYSER